jgi:inositol transport system substrate-binding protein
MPGTTFRIVRASNDPDRTGGNRMKKLLLILAATTAFSSAGFMLSASAETIGVSMAHFDDNFLTTLREAIGAEAKTRGITIQFEDAQGDVGKQLSQIQNFVAQHVDAIIVNPVDTSATPKMTQLAVAGKTPLVYVNRQPEDKTLPPSVVFVGSDEHVSGKLEGEEIARRLGNKGNVVIMEGELASNAAVLRTQDIEDVVKQHPDMKITQKQTANFQRNEAMDLMNNWLTSGDKIDAIAANNDEMAIGAIMALKQAGQDPKKVIIGGIDATADGLAEIANGNLAVTVFQDAKGQGRGAVDAADKLAKGQHVDSIVMVPFQIVTKDNYKQFMK